MTQSSTQLPSPLYAPDFSPTRRLNKNTGKALNLLAASLSLALLSGLSASTAMADALGVRAGAYGWHPDYDGTVKSGGESVDLKNDLGYTDANSNVFFIALEHPIPLLPNILLQHTQLDSSATNQLSRSFTFDDVTYNTTDTVNSDLDLSHTDATLYYEVLDNWVQLDLGLTIRYFDGGVKIRSVDTGENSKYDLTGPIPMLYASARFDLPLGGLYVAVDGNGIDYSGNSLIDYRAMLGYETKIGLGAEVGVRNFHLRYEDGNDKADVTANGLFAELFFHF